MEMPTSNPHQRQYKRQGTPAVSTTNAANEKVGEPVHRSHPADSAKKADTTSLSYVCMKPMKVGGVQKQPGDLIPEANGWRNVHNYVSTGYLAVVGS